MRLCNTALASALCMASLLAGLTPSEARAQVLQPGELCSDHSDAAIVTFEDPNLEAAVRAALSLGEQDDLTCGLVSGLTELEADVIGIESLAGIQNLTGLRDLELWGNAITDVSELAGLTSLRDLNLGNNSIDDVSELGGLTGLTRLVIRENSITDIGVLRNLTRLTNVDISFNSISDIGPLSELTDLATLRVYNNPITDIGALRGLTELTELHVHDLPSLSDIEPLMNNTGLGPGDRVILYNSAVTCEDASALKARGVSVGSSCVFQAALRWSFVILAGGLAVVGVVVARRRRASGESWP